MIWLKKFWEDLVKVYQNSSKKCKNQNKKKTLMKKNCTTLVIGASKGRLVSLAKLVRLKPSEATERTSKLQRLIECRDPLGASFGCGREAMKSF